MNLAAGRDELSSRGFDYLSTSRLNIMLNNAKNTLEDSFAWPWLETTTTGLAPLTISDLKYVLYVVDTTNMLELTGVDARDVALRDTIVTTAGAPDAWWLDGETTLKTYPTSSTASLSVRYVKYSPELVADSDTPLIPVRYHPLWVDFAVVEAYQDSDNQSAAYALMGFIETYRLPQMIEVYASRNRANSGYAQVRSGSFDD